MGDGGEFGNEGRFLCSDGSGGPLQRFGYGCCSFRRMEVYWHVAMGRPRPIEQKVELCTALDRVEEVSSCHMQVGHARVLFFVIIVGST